MHENPTKRSSDLSRGESALARHIRPAAGLPANQHGPKRLRRRDLPADTVELARYLIGKTLVHDHVDGRMSGRIVETEAYVIGDAACHAFRGETPRNRALFLDRGHAYVYFIYGSYFMMNISSESRGVGAGVLLRAVEPLEGIAFMQMRRKTTRLLDLARGPGRLATAMDINKRHDGLDLCSERRGDGMLWLGTAVQSPAAIGVSTRIGLKREADRRLRFYERGNNYVSGPVRLRE